jgi:hypothetical protein
MTANNPVTFEHAGKTYSLPNIQEVKPGAWRKARKGTDEMDKAFLLLEIVLGEDSPELAALDELEPEAFNAVIEQWMQGATPGESVSSES